MEEALLCYGGGAFADCEIGDLMESKQNQTGYHSIHDSVQNLACDSGIFYACKIMTQSMPVNSTKGTLKVTRTARPSINVLADIGVGWTWPKSHS